MSHSWRFIYRTLLRLIGFWTSYSKNETSFSSHSAVVVVAVVTDITYADWLDVRLSNGLFCRYHLYQHQYCCVTSTTQNTQPTPSTRTALVRFNGFQHGGRLPSWIFKTLKLTYINVLYFCALNLRIKFLYLLFKAADFTTKRNWRQFCFYNTMCQCVD